MNRTKIMVRIGTDGGAHRGDTQTQVLTGDTRLSCEALLCLSVVGHAPDECSKALSTYEAMKAETAFHPSMDIPFYQ